MEKHFFIFILACTLLLVKCDHDPSFDSDEELSVDEQSFVSKQKTTYEFGADKDKIMKILISSLYKNKEVFLRELVSNAQDALAKASHEHVHNPNYLGTMKSLAVWIKYDEAQKTLTVRDSGIGMTKNDLINHLGTIARSGTSEFLKKLEEAASSDQLTNDLIGQFGVGFYSSFLVAEKIVVISKHNDDDQHIWESDSHSFSVAKDPRGNTLGRGTSIILHLKDNAKEYASFEKLSELVGKYSQFNYYDIFISKEVEKSNDSDSSTSEPATQESDDKDVSNVEKNEEDKENISAPEGTKDDENSEATNKESDDLIEDEEPNTEDETEHETDTKQKKTYEYKLVNDIRPIWLRKSSEVSDDEYMKFYHGLSKDKTDDYIMKAHFKVEGSVGFSALIFLPSNPEFLKASSKTSSDLNQLHLYVRRVYIKSDTSNLLPSYLSTVVGVIDSDDLPLNVAREEIQHNQIIELIKKKLMSKILEIVSKLPNDLFNKFYEKYSTRIKFGIASDSINRKKLFPLLRYPTSYTIKNSLNDTSFSEYVKRMKKDQSQIFYVISDTVEGCMNSSYSSTLVARGYEVVYMTTALDDYAMANGVNFENVKFQNVAKEGVRVGKNEKLSKLTEVAEAEYGELIKYLSTKSELSQYVKSINVSLEINQPCLLITDKAGLTGDMERLFKTESKTYIRDKTRLDEITKLKKIMKINTYHPLIQTMQDLVLDENRDEKELSSLVDACFSIAQLHGSFTLNNEKKFAAVLEDMALRSIGQNPEKVSEFLKNKISDLNKIIEDGLIDEGSQDASSREGSPQENSSTNDASGSASNGHEHTGEAKKEIESEL